MVNYCHNTSKQNGKKQHDQLTHDFQFFITADSKVTNYKQTQTHDVVCRLMLKKLVNKLTRLS